ncbi:MAG: polysaccharide deacetylase family protein [Henriciella sp.]
MIRHLSALLGMGLLAACAVMPAPETAIACPAAPQMGEFDPVRDVFVGHFDTKPDVDDLHTIAAVGSLLKHPDFACVEAIGVAGAYGTQGGDYIHSPDLFDLAFGENWVDGHNDRAGTIEHQAALFSRVLGEGGHVWIMIAGQADIAADALVLAMRGAPDLPYRTHLHLVQHSDWNESVTDPQKLTFVQAETDYRKIADGNATGNGTPGYNTDDGSLWPGALGNADIGGMWQEAKRLADEHNPTAAYVNPSVAAGGFDFSDTTEMAYIFGLGALDDTEAFFDYVAPVERGVWPGGAKAALALTYDDALNSQLNTAIPQLNARGMKATFYISLGFDQREEKILAWRTVAEAGHELGNHTLIHPCRASLPGREWVQPSQDLDGYTKQQLLDELTAANELLAVIDGTTERTYAYTCGDVTAGGQSYVEDLPALFLGARGVTRDAPYDAFRMPSFAVDETPAKEMIAYADELIANQAIGSITFHGIGGDHLWVAADEHAVLLDYLQSRQSDIWVAPLRDILRWKAEQERG